MGTHRIEDAPEWMRQAAQDYADDAGELADLMAVCPDLLEGIAKLAMAEGSFVASRHTLIVDLILTHAQDELEKRDLQAIANQGDEWLTQAGRDRLIELGGVA